MNLLDLYNDIFTFICYYLKWSDILTLSKVNRYFRDLTRNSLLIKRHKVLTIERIYFARKYFWEKKEKGILKRKISSRSTFYMREDHFYQSNLPPLIGENGQWVGIPPEIYEKFHIEFEDFCDSCDPCGIFDMNSYLHIALNIRVYFSGLPEREIPIFQLVFPTIYVTGRTHMVDGKWCMDIMPINGGIFLSGYIWGGTSPYIRCGKVEKIRLYGIRIDCTPRNEIIRDNLNVFAIFSVHNHNQLSRDVRKINW
jgi:hypothetical protein